MIKTTSRPLLNRIAFALLWAFVFTLPMIQATEIPAIGIISKAAGLLAVAGCGAVVVSRRQMRVMGPVQMMMGAFILWSAVTLCWSVAPELTVQRISTYLQLFVLVLLIWEMCEEEKDVLRIMGAFVLGTIVPGLSTLLAFLPGQQTLYQRAAAPGFDPNELAFLLALSLPVAYYLTLRIKTPITAIYHLQMGIAVTAILLTGSAGAMIAMVTGLSLVFWTFHLLPVRTRINIFALVMILGGAAILFLPVGLRQHLSEESRKDAIGFTNVVNTGLESLHKAPLGGLGAGSMATSHSSFAMFAETGVVGVACFVAMLGVLLMSAERTPSVTRSFWYTVLAVWAVGVCWLNWEASQAAWLLFGLLAAHSARKQEGVTPAEQQQKRNYYTEAEVWS